MSGVKVLKIGPAASVQDLGRPGLLDQGVPRGGAADPLALAEGAALLQQDPGFAALEMAGMGGSFEATGALRIALTGAPMSATLDGAALIWNASYRIEAGQRLEIGPARRGVYGYLHLGGGIDVPSVLGARATHLAAGLGKATAAGEVLVGGQDSGAETGLTFRCKTDFRAAT